MLNLEQINTYPTASFQYHKGVRTLHPDYIKFYSMWQKCRDVIAGEEAVKQKGITYLPKLKKQDQFQYISYVIRANFYNATARTISGLVGMLFRKPPTNDSPPAIEALLKDADMAGTPFDVFAQQVADECLGVGRVGVLVDHAPIPADQTEVITKDQAAKKGLRPNFKLYPTESIINWRFDQVDNVWSLIQVVLQEAFTFPHVNDDGSVDEFSNDTEQRYRVLDLFQGKYRQRVFRIDKNDKDQLVEGSEIFPLMDNTPIGYIPFIVITPEGMSFTVEEPPLIDLVDVNLSHYRSSADYENGCHFTALPTLFIAGYQAAVPEGDNQPEEIYLGSQTAITMSNPDAKAQFIEFTGQGLSALENNMDRKEAQMGILGARMLATEGKQQQSTTTTAIHRTGENSILSSISIAVSLGLSKLLCIFADWAGTSYDCNYQINKDFLPVTIDGPTLTAMVANWQAGGMNDEEYFDWQQRGDLIEADVSFEDHKKGDFQEKPVLPTAKPAGAGPTMPPVNANPEAK